ncbi:MAG TPA: penicillin-binding protein activator LpoB [Phycisphaerales bacterium]|nr:penicillin-binding protein activator LpoB [Phycisphaerales bacterium]
MKYYWIAAGLTLATLAGCQQPTVYIDTTNDPGKPVMALDYRDFDQAAAAMVESLMRSGALRKPEGGRYVVTTGRIINDTMQRIDTDQLMAKIEQEMANSGQVVMTSAVGGKGATDTMIDQMRQIRDSAAAEEFREDTLPATRQLIAPELSIAGKIIQRNIRYDRNTEQVEYYFQLQLTDLTSGLRLWQEEQLIGKRGDRKAVSW